MGLIDNLREGLASAFQSPGQPQQVIVKEDEAPKQSQRMDVLNLPTPSDNKGKDYLKAFRGWVYRAVDSTAQEVASISLKLYQRKGDNVEVVDEHDSLDVLNRVNEFQTKYDLLYATQAYLELMGEAFWYRAKDDSGQTRELWLLRPDWVRILPPKEEGEFIGGYGYKVPGTQEIKYDRDRIIHLKYFDPLNPYRGKGTLQAADYAYDTDLFSSKYNRNFFYNNAIPNTVLKTEQSPSEEEIKRIRSSWKSKFGGLENAHKFAILTGGLEIDEAMNQSMKDMQFLEMRKFSRDEIFTIFQIPKTIVAITEDVNRANAKEHKAVWMENVIQKKMEKLVGFLNEFYLPEWGDELYFGFEDPVPESQELNLRIATEAADVLTINERRELVGKPSIAEGDFIYMPLNIMPTLEGEESVSKGYVKLDGKVEKDEDDGVIVEHKTTRLDRIKRKVREKLKEQGVDKSLSKIVHTVMSKEAQETEDADEEETHKPDLETSYAFWDAMVKRSENQEVKLQDRLVTFFNQQEEKVIEKVENIKAVGMIKNVDRYIFDQESENEILVEMVEGLIRTIVTEAGTSALELIGSEEGFEFTELVQEQIRNFNFKFAGSVNQTTYDKVKKQLIEGIGNDESVPEIKKRIGNVYGQATDVRSEAIARTETIRANNMANIEAWKQSGVVTKKEWLIAGDERTCEFCRAMDENYRERALEENFLNQDDVLKGVDGGEYRVSYSDLQAPPLHPQCRCTVIPVTLSETGGKDYTRKLELREKLDELESEKEEKEQQIKELKQKEGEIDKELQTLRERELQKIEEEADKYREELKSQAEQKSEKIIEEAKRVRDGQRKEIFEQ